MCRLLCVAARLSSQDSFSRTSQGPLSFGVHTSDHLPPVTGNPRTGCIPTYTVCHRELPRAGQTKFPLASVLISSFVSYKGCTKAEMSELTSYQRFHEGAAADGCQEWTETRRLSCLPPSNQGRLFLSVLTWSSKILVLSLLFGGDQVFLPFKKINWFWWCQRFPLSLKSCDLMWYPVYYSDFWDLWCEDLTWSLVSCCIYEPSSSPCHNRTCGSFRGSGTRP